MTGFANEGQFLLMNTASLKDLNQRISARALHKHQQFYSPTHVMSQTAGALARFRPNLLVGGPNIPPYAEDSWHELQIGNNTFYAAGETLRYTSYIFAMLSALTSKLLSMHVL